MAGHVFISHSTLDDPLVAKLRLALERIGYSTWTDSRQLTGGDQLHGTVRQAIVEASHLVALLSVNGVNSPWVSREVKFGLEQMAAREGFKVIPLVIPPLQPASLQFLLPEELLALTFDPEREQVTDLLVKLRAALGGSLPTDPELTEQPKAAPLAELTVELTQLTMELDEGGKRRAKALATLRWSPPDGEPQTSQQFWVRSALGPIEAGELAWYLERYAIWPGEHFRQRAREVEENLPVWGERLFATLDTKSTQPIWEEFRRVKVGVERCITIHVEPEPPEGSSKEAKAESAEAATVWLGLPWELLRDAQGFLAAYSDETDQPFRLNPTSFSSS